MSSTGDNPQLTKTGLMIPWKTFGRWAGWIILALVVGGPNVYDISQRLTGQGPVEATQEQLEQIESRLTKELDRRLGVEPVTPSDIVTRVQDLEVGLDSLGLELAVADSTNRQGIGALEYQGGLILSKLSDLERDMDLVVSQVRMLYEVQTGE